MMTGLDKLEELTICSVDEFTDEEVRMTETTSFYLSEKCSRIDFFVTHKMLLTANPAGSICD